MSTKFGRRRQPEGQQDSLIDVEDTKPPLPSSKKAKNNQQTSEDLHMLNGGDGGNNVTEAPKFMGDNAQGSGSAQGGQDSQGNQGNQGNQGYQGYQGSGGAHSGQDPNDDDGGEEADDDIIRKLEQSSYLDYHLTKDDFLVGRAGAYQITDENGRAIAPVYEVTWKVNSIIKVVVRFR